MVKTQTCSFRTTIHKYTILPVATVDGTGDLPEVEVPAEDIFEQVGWLINIVNMQANDMIHKHFNFSDLVELHLRSNFTQPHDLCKLDSAGQTYLLPVSGHAAAARLGWTLTVDDAKNNYGTYLSSRMLRMSTEAAVENLRSTARRAILTDALINYRLIPNKLRLNDLLLDLKQTYNITTSKAEIRNRFNAIDNYEKRVGPRVRFNFFDMETPAVLSDRLLAYAADSQFQQYLTIPGNDKDGSVGSDIVWEVKLPVVPNPQTRDDYRRVQLHYRLPEYVQQFKELNTPTIRIDKSKQDHRRLVLDCSYIRYVTPVVSATKRRAAPVVGLDWGVRNPVTLIVGHRTKSGRFVLDSRPQYFKCDDLLIKRVNLQTENDELLTKIKRLTAQYLKADQSGKAGLDQLACISAKIEKLVLTRNTINVKRFRLSHHVAYAVAHWVMDQVIATGAKVVYCEDLKTLNTGPKGEYNPARHLVTTAIRTKIFEYLTLLCERNGIVLRLVNAYNTSRTCSGCDSLDTSFYTHSVSKNPVPHRHYKPPAPSRAGSWFYCNTCGYSTDRDYNAAVNIARFGLKTTVFTRKNKSKSRKTPKTASGATSVPKVVHNRRKKFTTPKRPKPNNKHNNNRKHKDNSFSDFRSTASTYLRPRRRRGTSQTHTQRCVSRVSQASSYGLFPYVHVKQLQLVE